MGTSKNFPDCFGLCPRNDAAHNVIASIAKQFGKQNINFRNALMLVALIFCTVQSQAQEGRGLRQKWNPILRTHYLSVWEAAGYSRLNMTSDLTLALGNIGTLGGAAYEYKSGNNFLMAAGIEWNLFNSSVKPYDFKHERDLYDTNDKPFRMYYKYTGYYEMQIANYLNIPLSVGYSGKNYYFLTGIKIGIHLASSYLAIAHDQHTTARYLQYIDEFEEMPNHFIDSKRISQLHSIRFSTNTVASLEIGRYIRQPDKPFRLRVAVFCDYGLTNISTHSATPLITYKQDPTQFHANSITESVHNTSNAVHTLLVGVKITQLFQLRIDYRCNCPPKEMADRNK